MEIRNIANIAHVDHGKTTLIDAILKATGAIPTRVETAERIMDSNDQERERGITIFSKNASVNYKGTKINIVDTPGHADFGSEVERVLRSVDAALLLVDAFEGPMPQTRFVLGKALEIGLKMLVVINKIDRPMARPDAVLDMTLDLFDNLGASEEQLDFPYIFTIARDGVAVRSLDDPHEDITPLLDFIMEHVKPAAADAGGIFRMQPATLAYDNYVGRIAVGRVYEGRARGNTPVYVIGTDGARRVGKITRIYSFEGLDRIEAKEAVAGDIVAIAGIPDIYVGETITNSEDAEPLPAIRVDPPTVAMSFLVNNSPFAGREGKFVTSRHILARLIKETESNVGLKIESDEKMDSFRVMGRGEMCLAVLIEQMRREGYELQVSRPEVIMREINGKMYEPIERGAITVPDELSGRVIEAINIRQGRIEDMKKAGDRAVLEFEIPTRGLLGFRAAIMTMTRGEGVLYHSFDHYGPKRGAIKKRQVGSMISGFTGVATAFSLNNLQERGPLFIGPGTEVYEGMIVGEHNKGADLTVTPIKGKQLTNMRASGADDAIKLTPPIQMTLEAAIEYIQDDEYAEITPSNIRIRKILTSKSDRKRQNRREAEELQD
ncbi:MAG TPA: translational GTPase TypA [bacterium]|nr:MAG: GTP-binding protein TypA/BipA [bacterium ADurb.Bin236]HPI76233.1 translational GTPase TypA [bacterium]HPN93003.1 translational GTPase TypA [bacterium]